MTPSPEFPPTRPIRRNGTHRLIPSKYTVNLDSVLLRIADGDRHLQDLFDLDHATNERLWAENNLLPGIGAAELVYDTPNHRVVNAAFTHAHPLGSRFNGPDRGAWYAGFAVETAQAEVAFHKSTEYAEIGRFEDSVTYDDYLADFNGSFHDLRKASAFEAVLAPDSYHASQTLSQRLFDSGSSGVVYPSVRHRGGTCIACFRPAMVRNVRKQATYRFTWAGNPVPQIT